MGFLTRLWQRLTGPSAPAELLDCGCTRGSTVIGCIYCGNTRCLDHRDRPHPCPRCPACGVRHGYPVHEAPGQPWAVQR